ncbi:hypothetical protein PENANT_c006G03867 [Penicillium antarcticum]|uniref:Uncharacterized protein n=1 Tax=Penicillium antarcticum TaxID=416450 RepID=A0A1V6QDK7_9EURO|nr:uncharacterized protein N7508_009171 [Penicillium antarcticum]KAJ5294350.1 hypothetical protein N7508_009171 [Penicillium antarcticum]OQD87290.1 hypothetical protein PENANT_c006G03867 [Penicillium antarcticum]
MSQQDMPRQTTSNPTFKVDMTWKKWKAMISDLDKPEEGPQYIVSFPWNMLPKSESMIVKRASDEEVVGTGKLQMVSINAYYNLHGQKGSLLAQKRWQTVYTHRSLNFSDTDTPVTMTWTSDYGFKTWDFVCVDENQNPVARFSANQWAVSKVGKIEFDGPKAHDQAAQEEIFVIGLTLFYTMILRTTNIFNFFGAIFARPGHKQHLEPEPESLKVANEETSQRAVHS